MRKNRFLDYPNSKFTYEVISLLRNGIIQTLTSSMIKKEILHGFSDVIPPLVFVKLSST